MRSTELRQPRVVAIVYGAATFMAVLDTTIVNVALPTVGREFRTGADTVGIVSISYLVSLAVFIPVSGWIGDRFGGRPTLLAAIAVFAAASILCGLAGTLDELIAFRLLQGVGGAAMTLVGMAMLFRVYLSRRWVFFVNVPIALSALVYGAVGLPNDEAQPNPGRLDARGFVLSGLGLGSTMFGLSEGPTRGWTDPLVVILLVVGVALLVAMVVVERRLAAPFIDVRLLRNHLFRAATTIYALGSVAYLGAIFLAALFFQNALGIGPVHEVAGHATVTVWAYHGAFLVGAGVAALSVVVALTVRNSEASATMTRRPARRPVESYVQAAG